MAMAVEGNYKKKTGMELSEIGTRIRQVAVSSIGGCFASLSGHPFLVGHICILIFLYRSSPFLFSLLVSASPVLICTAILLGTLLCFGQPNLPETENEAEEPEEERTTTPDEPLPLIIGASRDAISVDQSFCKPSTSDSARNDGFRNLNSETESRADDIWEDSIDEFKRNEEREENHYPLILKSDSEKSLTNSFDSETATVNSPNSPHFPDEENEEVEEEDEEEDVISGSGSDGGESSSPDASMADMMPMLDELHPLLDEDSSNPIHISRVGSDLASEHSLPSSTTSSRDTTDGIIENCRDFEVEEEDDNEDEDEGEKEEELKSAIVWTEEDEKNLLDLGSSEIERNQRLENLILRRGRRKNLSMVPEINLIDLEGSDVFPPHIGLISTARKNPFDDSYDNSNIPGSAPSVLLHRRNPFDIPYERSSDPIEDRFQEGFTPFFKRHESFTVGPSVFAPNTKMRPFFVPEQAIAEEPDFAPFDHQSSDSKANSVLETESVGSVIDEDQERIVIKKQFSEEEDGVSRGPQLISEMNHVAEHIGHGSQSSSEYEEDESLESGDMNSTCISGDNIPHVGPVYDSSPPVFRKNLSSSSCGSSDVHAESHTNLPPVLVKRMVSFAEKDSENWVIEKEVIAGDSSPNSDGDDYQEAKERLTTTPSGGGNTSMFYDIAMHEPNFENLEEVPVPNTPVESNVTMRTIPVLNIPKIYKLDHCTSSPTRGSPLCPDFISTPSRASSQIDVQTIHEAEDIKEIDKGLSSDIDSVGDFNVTRSGSSSIELEKHVIDSVGDTNPTGDVIEVNHVIDSAGGTSRGNVIEVKETEHQATVTNRRDEIDESNHDHQNNISRETSELRVGEAIPSEGSSL